MARLWHRFLHAANPCPIGLMGALMTGLETAAHKGEAQRGFQASLQGRHTGTTSLQARSSQSSRMGRNRQSQPSLHTAR
jgi:hypothetical protein